jgi:hypothetical protein
MIGIYNMQPRALTIKKNKIKCILLEFPLCLRGKRVNFSQLFSFGIFIPFFTTVGAGLRTAEIPGNSHLLSICIMLPQVPGWWLERTRAAMSMSHGGWRGHEQP